MDYSYLIPIFVGLIINLYIYAKQQSEDVVVTLDKTVVMDKPFASVWANELYSLSFSPLFAKFIDEDEFSERSLDENRMIAEAGLSDLMNYRVLNVLKALLLFAALVITVIMFLLSNYTGPIIEFLFGFEDTGERDLTVVAIVGVVALIGAITPGKYIKSKSNRNSVGFQEDLPILQLFLVLLLGANRPIGEVLYILSKTNMRYHAIFATSYRIYLRDREAAFNYLRGVFSGTHFVDSIDILASYQDYSKTESLQILKNNLEILQEDVLNYKKSKNIGKNIFTEGSVALPFVALFLLGLAPVIVYALGMMGSAQSMGAG